MTLQFNAAPYLAAFQQGQQQNNQVREQEAQALNAIPQGIGAVADYQNQQKQSQMQNLMVALKAGEQGYDPGAFLDYLGPGSKSPAQPNPTPSPMMSPGVNQELMPNMRPGQGLEASAGVSDMGPRMPQPSPSPSPITKSPIIDAWNKSRGSVDQMTSSAPQKATGPQGLFTKKPFDVNGVLTQLKSGDASALANLNDKQMKQLEATPAYIQMKKKEGAMPVDEAAALLNLDDKHAEKLRKVYGNGLIPQDKWTMLSSGVKMDATMGTKESQQQDRLEQQARNSVSQLRGDKSLARAEEQRDAAIVAYNRIQEIEQRGAELNPIDYTDILGQIYKARTGSAPTERVLEEIRQATAKGQFGKAYTFVTGQQAPATSKDITASLKDMASSMGQQADRFHEGYMKAHLIKPQGLEESRWQPILTTGRGQSFKEAIGSGSGNQTQGLMWQGRPLKDTPANRAWLQQQGGQK